MSVLPTTDPTTIRRWGGPVFRTIVTFVIGAIIAASIISVPQPASAAPVVGFDPGNIIDDSVFYDRTAMTESAIQAFLTQKGASCTAGSLCLKNYKMTTVTRPADAMCNTYTGAANETAARIIHKVAQACGINPQVLIVMLEKEQSLVTMKAPTASRYKIAMGYGCPDTAACDAKYFGFFNQVYKAASQLIRYTNPAGTTKYFTWFGPGKTVAIQWHPDTACGTSNVNVVNKATASLYYYTPYRPNPAAIAAGYGTGDKCSAYGNRNFYSYFTSWFGSVRGAPAAVGPDATRLGGVDRYATAVEISKSSYAAGVPVVYVATGVTFPDALAAAPAAAAHGGPLLLTPTTSLPTAVADEIKRVKPARIVVVGGTGAVSTSVYNKLAALAPSIRRDTGVDRYQTSQAVVRAAFPNGSGTAFIATGRNFPDALAASAAAGAIAAPVLLVDGNTSAADATTKSLLSSLNTKKIVIAGATGVVSSGIESTLAKTFGAANVSRKGGDDRYATAAAINGASFTASEAVYLTDGSGFADALAGAALAGKKKAPLYPVRSTCVPQEIRDDIERVGATKVVLFGGAGALSSAVEKLSVCR